MASIASRPQSGRDQQRNKSALRGVKVLATGSYAPDVVIKNSDLTSLGCDEEWIVQRTGIQERRHCAPDQSTSDMAFYAAEACLAKANFSAKDLDLIIVATMTPDFFMPATATGVQAKLGCNAVAFDLNAACSGFAYAMVTGAQFLKTGVYRSVLVIGADANSRLMDPQDVKTYPLFGDAAGAVLMTYDEPVDPNAGPGILSCKLGATGEMGDLIKVPGGAAKHPASQEVLEKRMQYMKMDGRPVFKWAVRTIPAAINEVLSLAGLSTKEIDFVMLHQANLRIIDAAAQSLEMDKSKILTNLQKYGNTSAASIPLLWDEAISNGVVRLEDRVVLCGFGAGLTWGSCVYQGS